MNYIQNMLGKNKRLLTLLAILAIIAVIPITVFVSQQQQQIRQRAEEKQTSLYFAKQGSTDPLTNIVLPPNENFSINLHLDTKELGADGFDITINLPQDITNLQVQEGSDANNFKDLVFPPDLKNNSIRFSRGNLGTETVIVAGKLHLLTLTFTVGGSPGSIEVAKAKITKPISSSEESPTLTVFRPTLAYTISAIAVGPAAGGTAPTPTPAQIAIVSSPTPTSAPASRACSSNTSCATCINAPDCGWDGVSCLRASGTPFLCPEGKTAWFFANCATNACANITPTPIPFPTQRPIQCDIDTEEGAFRCRTNCILNEIEVGGSTTCNRNPGTICCLDRSKRLPTPTPTPSATCNNSNSTVDNDCFKRFGVFCAVGSSCKQNSNSTTKDCTCQSDTLPTPTPGPTSTPTPIPACPLKPKGDADCNRQINIVDFNVWRDEFTGKLKTTTADFNSDGSVDIKDFSAWRDGFIAENTKKK